MNQITLYLVLKTSYTNILNHYLLSHQDCFHLKIIIFSTFKVAAYCIGMISILLWNKGNHKSFDEFEFWLDSIT